MQEARFLELLGFCLSALDLPTISRMCACSKAMQEQLLGLVQTEGAGLLLRATQEAAQTRAKAPAAWSTGPDAEAARAQARKASSALDSLLRHAPAAAAALDVPALLRIPDMNCELAQLLLGAGVRVSYAQLVAAARERVRGVEAWVAALRAFPELMAESGVPEVLQDLLGERRWVMDLSLRNFSPSPDDPGLPDLLHLVVNSLRQITPFNYHDNAYHLVMNLLSDQLLAAQPQLVLELLHTAVQRRAADVVQQLLRAPAAGSMQLDDLLKLVKADLHSGTLVRRLLALPAAAQLDADEHVGQLLLHAAQYSGMCCGGTELCDHPAAANMSPHMVVAVLRACITPGKASNYNQRSICACVCQLPAAAAIGSETVAELLAAAVGSPDLVDQLCQLPAAGQLSSNAIKAVSGKDRATGC